MPKGNKSKYTDKQKRQAQHIEEGYKKRGVNKNRAEQIAYATVNKTYGGGASGGSGSKTPKTKESYKRGGKRGGAN